VYKILKELEKKEEVKVEENKIEKTES